MLTSQYLKVGAFVVLLFNFSHYSYAQLVGFAMDGGVVGSNVQSTGGSGNEYYGFNGGLKLDFSIVESVNGRHPIRVSPEIFIRQAGSNEFVSNIAAVNFSKIDLTYLGMHLPITLAFVDGELRPTGVMLQLGIFLDYIVDDEVVVGSSRVNAFNTTRDRMDFGLSFNLQFHIAEHGAIVLGYNYGVNDISFASNLSNSMIGNNRGFFVNYCVAVDFSSE